MAAMTSSTDDFLLQNFNHVWVFIMLMMWLSNCMMKTIILGYLREKPIGQQSLMDRAHALAFNTMGQLNHYYMLVCLLIRTLDHTKGNDWIMALLDLGFNFFVYVHATSFVLDVVIQYLMVTKADQSWNLRWDDDQVMTMAATTIRIVLLAIAIILSAAGDRTAMYYSQLGLEHHFSTLEILRQIYLFGCTGILGILRIVLKFTNKIKKFGSNQVLSNKALVSFMILHITFEVIRKSIFPRYFSYIYDLHIFSAIAWIQAFSILLHHDLRQYSLRRLERVDLGQWLFKILQHVNLTFQILFTPLSVNYCVNQDPGL